MNRYLELFHKLNPTAPLERDSNILIIDGTNTFIRVFSNVPALNDNGDHVGGVVGFLKSVGFLIRKEMPTRCIIVFDGKGGSQRRRKLYPEYKNNRKPNMRLNRFNEFNSPEDEASSLKYQFSRVFEYLNCLPVTVICVDNIEADDTIAYIVELYRKKTDSKITISSTDKDFLQLVTENVRVWNPIKKVLYTPEEIQKQYEIYYDNYILYRVLTGDSSDNISGVKGVGLKTLIKRFPELLERKITIEDIIDMVTDLKERYPKIKLYEQIHAAADQLHLNNKLMQLETVNISGNSKLLIQNKVDETVELNRKEFLKIFFEDGLNTMIKDPHAWVSNTFTRLETYGK